ncbi:VOC family protein [Reinekea sp.]|jgi:catechol 2,3-dioxygenase-like lactoylglutathione lyase family enzyme|uniref:VOC family protein n=1 Tax=Reinekea sp. TaxID=1970455 RepID=UPI003989939A
MKQNSFRMGRLDHVHIRVPNRDIAAQWYSDYLGFEVVKKYDFWAKGFSGGPLQISADGGNTMLALFEASEGHPLAPQLTGVAFSVDSDTFISFSRSLPNGIESPAGQQLKANDIVDFDLCWVYNFVDPWGNHFELNCYEYKQIKQDLIAADNLTPVRYWPSELIDEYQK